MAIRKGAKAMPIRKQRPFASRQMTDFCLNLVSCPGDNCSRQHQDSKSWRMLQCRKSPCSIKPFKSCNDLENLSSIDYLDEHFKNVKIVSDSDAMANSSIFEVDKPSTARHQNQNMRYNSVLFLISSLEESQGLEVAIS
jgi:hypothetical protein